MNKVYIGVSGRILSGKSSAAKFFVEKFKAEHLRFSKVIDEILDILDLPISRINEQDMGALLKELYGEEVLTHALIERAKKSEKNIIVFEGIRKKEELDALRQLPGFKFIYIKTSPETRYQRMLSRNEKANEAQQSYEQFLASENHEADKKLAELEQYADFVVANEASQEQLEAQLTKILTESL